MSKKILFVSNHAEMIGGGEHSFLSLAANMPPGMDITAVVPNSGALLTYLRRCGVDSRISPLAPIRSWRLLTAVKSAAKLFNLCKRRQVALIYANGSRAALYSGIVAPLLGIPVVWHCRISVKDACLDPILLRLCKLVIANSKATIRRFKKGWRHKIRLVYNGLDPCWFETKAPGVIDTIEPEWRVLLMVARLSRSKRHDVALAAFEKVAADELQAHLFCVGGPDHSDASWWQELQRKSRCSQFSNRIHWVGPVTDTRPWYQVAELILMPAENESFGRVVVEAMACGVPVVAAKSGGIPEIVRDGIDGILVPQGNIAAFSKAIGRILSDKAFRNEIVSSARQRAEDFHMERHVNKMARIFEELLDQ